jgi:hypothetical protein
LKNPDTFSVREILIHSEKIPGIPHVNKFLEENCVFLDAHAETNPLEQKAFVMSGDTTAEQNPSHDVGGY